MINKPGEDYIINEVWTTRDYFRKGFCIQKNNTVIDVGAHIGAFTVYAAKLANKGEVYSFEPHPENFILLKKNCKLNNLKNVKLFKYGVAGKKKKAKLFIDKENTGGHNLYKNSQRAIPISCITLKGIFDINNIQFCDFLKLDCEGAEYDILFNTPDNYFDKINKIVLEYHDYLYKKKRWYNLVNFLSKKGFKVKINPFSSNRGIIYAKNSLKRNSLIIRCENYLRIIITGFQNNFKIFKNNFKIFKTKVQNNFKIFKTKVQNNFKIFKTKTIMKLDRALGIVGVFIKRHSPALYFKLKKIICPIDKILSKIK